MSDRELLELAGKAVGMRVIWDGEAVLADGSSIGWNPLSDDGDALRLAVSMGIEFRFRIDQGACVVAEQSASLASSIRSQLQPVIVNYVQEDMFSSSYAPDRTHAEYLTNIRGLERGVAAATRRAIVLVASMLAQEGSESNG